MTATVGSGVGTAGDEVARLYDAYAPKLRRFCRGRLRNAEDADDAVQTVFLRVYQALRGGTAPVYEAAWLYKIAHNVCLSRLESGAARARVEQPHDLDALQDVLAAPGERRDELVGLAEALAAMPTNLRQAILLREWQGLSYAEIAEALDVSVSAVETLIFRARRHLAAALESGAGAARSVGAVLQLPWLLRRLRSLLASGRGAQVGVAKVSAVAVLAAAGVGGGVAGTVLGAPSRPVPASTAAPAVAAAVRPGPAVQPVAAPAAKAAASAVVAARRSRTVPEAMRPATQAASERVATTVPLEVPGPAPVVPAPAAIAPAVASTTTEAATTTAPLPETTVAVPTATLPVPVPTIGVPTVSVPVVTAPVPTVSVPSVTVAVTATVPEATVTAPVVTVAVTTPALP